LRITTGALAAYLRQGDAMDLFEINAAVVRIASNPAYFRYLARADGAIATHVVDGRLGMAAKAAGTYDVVVIDAFSSDAIPVHLLTREALRTYVDKTTAHGIVALHVSNQFYDLMPVIDAEARAEGFIAAFATDDVVDARMLAEGKQMSRWAIVARTPSDLAFLREARTNWMTFAEATTTPWTDDYSTVLDALR
jgi:hypothetical protein